MATIASLIVEISAKSIKLKKGLSSATSKIKAFAKKAAKVLAGVGAFIGVGAVAAVVAITKTVNKYSAEIDKLAKTSSKLGIPVKALQKLQYQAELTGVSADTMNMALQRMTRRTSEAAKGTGEAKNALKELRLDANKLAQLSPDEQFYKISEAMKQISNQGDKVRLAMKIFDTEGVSLVNTMNGNLSQMGEEFDSLGISISASAAKMVEAYNDSKTKLGTIFSGFGIQLTAQLAEPFTRIIRWITEIIVEMGGMEVAANKFAGFMVRAIKSAVIASKTLINSFLQLENVMLRIENLKLIPGIAMDFAEAAKRNEAGYIGPSTQRSFDIDAQIAENTKKIDGNAIVKSLDKLLESLAPSRAFDKVTNSTSIMANSTNKAAKQATRFAEAADKATKSITPKGTKKTNVIDFGDMSSRIKAQDIFSGAGGFTGFGKGLSDVNKSAGRVRSIQEHIDASEAGKALQEMRKGIFGRNSGIGMSSAGLIPDYAEASGKTFFGDSLDKLLNDKPTTKITLNMITDAGEVSGELIGNQDFIDAIGRMQNRNTNNEARAVSI